MNKTRPTTTRAPRMAHPCGGCGDLGAGRYCADCEPRVLDSNVAAFVRALRQQSTPKR